MKLTIQNKKRRSEILAINRNLMHQVMSQVGEPINLRECEANKNQLKKLTPPPLSFYLELDMRTNTIIWTHGLEAVLGYADVDVKKGSFISTDTVFDWIHFSRLETYLAFGIAAYQTAHAYQKVIKPIQKQYYIVKVPMLHKNGEYFWMHQASAPYLVDKNKTMLSHMNFYTILSPFAGEEMEPPRLVMESLQYQVIEKDILVQSRGLFRPSIRFSKDQHVVVGAYLKNLSASVKELGETTGFGGTKVKNLNKLIKKNVNEYYQTDFVTAQACVGYLKGMGW